MNSSTKLLRRNNLMNGFDSVHRLYKLGGILDTTQYKGLYKKQRP